MELSQNKLEKLVRIQAWTRGQIVRQEIGRQLLELYELQREEFQGSICSSQRSCKLESDESGYRKGMANEYQIFHQDSEKFSIKQQLCNFQEVFNCESKSFNASLELDKKAREKIRKDEEDLKREKKQNEYMLFIDEQADAQAIKKLVTVGKKSPDSERINFPQVLPIYSNSQMKTVVLQTEAERAQASPGSREKLREIAKLLQEDEKFCKNDENENQRAINSQRTRAQADHQKPQSSFGQQYQQDWLQNMEGNLDPSPFSSSNHLFSPSTKQNIRIQKNQQLELMTLSQRGKIQNKLSLEGNQQIEESLSLKSIRSRNSTEKQQRKLNKLMNHKNQLLESDNSQHYQEISQFSLKSFKSNLNNESQLTFSENEMNNCQIDITQSQFKTENILYQNQSFSAKQLNSYNAYQKYLNAATDIQRIFRGYQSRKHKFFFCKAKKAVLVIEAQFLQFKLFLVKKMKECSFQIDRCSYVIIKLVKDYQKGEASLKRQFKNKHFHSKINSTNETLVNTFLSFIQCQDSPNNKITQLEEELHSIKVQLHNKQKQFQKEVKEIQLKHQQEMFQMQTKFYELGQFHKSTIQKYIQTIQTISTKSCSQERSPHKKGREMNHAKDKDSRNNNILNTQSVSGNKQVEKQNISQRGVSRENKNQKEENEQNHFSEDQYKIFRKAQQVVTVDFLNKIPNPKLPSQNQKDEIHFELHQNAISTNSKIGVNQMKRSTLSFLQALVEKDLKEFDKTIKTVKYYSNYPPSSGCQTKTNQNHNIKKSNNHFYNNNNNHIHNSKDHVSDISEKKGNIEQIIESIYPYQFRNMSPPQIPKWNQKGLKQ